MNETTTPQIIGTAGNPIDLKGRKIAIGYPSPELIDYRFHSSLIELITQTSQFVPLGLTNSVSSRIAVNRNTIVQNARLLGATDILWIDSDSVFPISSLIRLLVHDKDIVCATTCRRKGASREPVALPLNFAEVKPGDKLVRMKQIGFPFMLTKMAVFDKLDESGLAPDKCYFAEPPRDMMRKAGWDLPGTDALLGEDEYWCELVLKAGFDIWCDMELTMEIGHVGSDVFYVKQDQVQSVTASVDEVLSDEEYHRAQDGMGE